jgi:hypothetical protein
VPTLDIWSNASNSTLRGLLSSAIACLLIQKNRIDGRSIYICSPWISDFPVFDNRYGQYSDLLPRYRAVNWIRFGDVLLQLSESMPVRIISKDTEATRQFIATRPGFTNAISLRIADANLHEKGLLTPIFYIEGSMNFTYSGVHLNQEKVSYHAGKSPETVARITTAYLELDRRWEQLVS